MVAVVECGSSAGGSPIIATFSTPPNRGCSRDGSWAARGVAEQKSAIRESAANREQPRSRFKGSSFRTRRSYALSVGLKAADLWVEHVAQSISDEVESEDRQH